MIPTCQRKQKYSTVSVNGHQIRKSTVNIKINCKSGKVKRNLLLIGLVFQVQANRFPDMIMEQATGTVLRIMENEEWAGSFPPAPPKEKNANFKTELLYKNFKANYYKEMYEYFKSKLDQ